MKLYLNHPLYPLIIPVQAIALIGSPDFIDVEVRGSDIVIRKGARFAVPADAARKGLIAIRHRFRIPGVRGAQMYELSCREENGEILGQVATLSPCALVLGPFAQASDAC